MLNINTAAIRQALYRLVGLRSGHIGEADELVKLVCEVGRREEFDLLYEYGIQSWHASKEKTSIAGEAPHISINAPQGGTHLIIVERAEFETAAGIVRGFAGTNLGTSDPALVVNRDARFSRNLLQDIAGVVAVAGGVTTVVPPATGSRIWHSAFATPARWVGPQLLRATAQQFGSTTLDQLSFQIGQLGANTLTYTIYGYVVQARS